MRRGSCQVAVRHREPGAARRHRPGALPGPASERFAFARLAGTRHPRYSLRLHDERVSTLLALSAVYYYDRVLDDDPRKGLMNAFKSFRPGS